MLKKAQTFFPLKKFLQWVLGYMRWYLEPSFLKKVLLNWKLCRITKKIFILNTVNLENWFEKYVMISMQQQLSLLKASKYIFYSELKMLLLFHVKLLRYIPFLSHVYCIVFYFFFSLVSWKIIHVISKWTAVLGPGTLLRQWQVFL